MSTCSIQDAIKFLEENNVHSFKLMNVLTIPVNSLEEMESCVSTVSRLLKQCKYSGSWRVDPYCEDDKYPLS